MVNWKNEAEAREQINALVADYYKDFKKPAESKENYKPGDRISYTCFNEVRDTEAYRVVGDLKNSDYVVSNTFWVGVYPGMTDAMIDYMAQVIKEVVNI